MKENPILFENQYTVDRQVYAQWQRLGLVQSRGSLFFRLLWAGLLVLAAGDFLRNLLFGGGFSLVLLLLVALCAYRVFLLPRIRSNTMVKYMEQRAGAARWQRTLTFWQDRFVLTENGLSMEFGYDQIRRLAHKGGWHALIMLESGAVYLKADGFTQGQEADFWPWLEARMAQTS